MCPPVYKFLATPLFNDKERILPLSGCDAVPWVEWLKKYSLVVFEFNQLSLTFTKEGKPITLIGVSETPKLNMISNNGSQKTLLKKVGKLVGLLFSINTKPDIHLLIPNPILPLLMNSKSFLKNPKNYVQQGNKTITYLYCLILDQLTYEGIGTHTYKRMSLKNGC